ncbi:hypothetical protein MMC24_007798 [Lignoscripta atroalba]|nr:hypothetical protein [Lignoscripta atroalba]
MAEHQAPEVKLLKNQLGNVTIGRIPHESKDGASPIRLITVAPFNVAGVLTQEQAQKYPQQPKEPASLAGDGYYIKVKQEAPGFSGSASTKLFLIRGAPSSDQSTYSNTTALPYTGTITKTVTTTSLASLPQGPITGSATFTGNKVIKRLVLSNRNGLPLLGNLTTCPGDYATTSGACCPNGYSIHTSPIGAGGTPCVQTLSVAVPTPENASSTTGITTSYITNELLSIKYGLSPSSSPSRVSIAAIAGIAIAGCLGFLTLITVLLLWNRRTKQRQKDSTFELDDTTIEATDNDNIPELENRQAPAEVGAENGHAHTDAELEALPRFELNGEPRRQELEGSNVAKELPALPSAHMRDTTALDSDG